MMLHAGYLRRVIHDPAKVISEVKKALTQMKKGRKRVTALVGVGISGAMSVPMIARDLKLRYAIIRKRQSNSHSTHKVEGNMIDADRWVFVDDLIDSGSTLAYAVEMMRDYRNHDFHFAGAYLFEEKEGHRATSNWIIELLDRHGITAKL